MNNNTDEDVFDNHEINNIINNVVDNVVANYDIIDNDIVNENLGIHNEDNDTAIDINTLEMEEFREILLVHFDMLFDQKVKIVWPSRLGHCNFHYNNLLKNFDLMNTNIVNEVNYLDDNTI
jgi:hypothetical protein